MRLVTMSVHAKHPAAPAEDVAVATDGLAAVIDGVTDKTGLPYHWQGEPVTSGRFAALVVAQVLTCADPATSPRDLVETATTALREAVAAQHPGLEQRYFPGCVLVVYQPALHLVWRVGDTQFAVDGTVNCEVKAIDLVTSRMRAAVNHTYLSAGADPDLLTAEDPGRAAITDLLARQQLLANRPGPFGYGVLNGADVPEEYLELFPIAPTPGQRLVLASDGYPEVLESYTATEQRLADLLAADPLCIDALCGTKAVPPGADSFDDRTWVEVLT